jgi:nucleoside phosphorylase
MSTTSNESAKSGNPLLIVFALPFEARATIRALGLKRTTCGLWTGNNLAVAVLGAGGAANVKRSLPDLLDSINPRLVVSAGFSGALTTEYQFGTVLTGNDAMSLALARDLGLPSAKFAPSDVIVESDEQRATIATATGAAIVDMESAAVRACCEAHGIPCATIRVVSDSPDRPLPVPSRVLWDHTNNRARPGALALYLLLHPWRITAFMRAMRDWNLARQSLARTLVRVSEAAPLPV